MGIQERELRSQRRVRFLLVCAGPWERRQQLVEFRQQAAHGGTRARFRKAYSMEENTQERVGPSALSISDSKQVCLDKKTSEGAEFRSHENGSLRG